MSIFNCTSGGDVQKPRNTILKRGRTIIKKRFEPMKIIVSDMQTTKSILKSHAPRTKSILKNRTNEEERGNSVWFDLSDSLTFNVKTIPKRGTQPDEAVDSADNKKPTDTNDFRCDDHLALNNHARVICQLIKEKCKPKIVTIDSTTNFHNGQTTDSSIKSPSSKPDCHPVNEAPSKRLVVTTTTTTPTTCQSPKEKCRPKIIDSTPKLHNGQVQSTPNNVTTTSSRDAKFHAANERHTCKLTTTAGLKQTPIIVEPQNNALLDKITGIQNTGQDIYSINVSNSRFFVPNNYVFTNYDSSMDDLSFKVDPEVTKALRKSLEEKAKSSTTDITELLKRPLTNDKTRSSSIDGTETLKRPLIDENFDSCEGKQFKTMDTVDAKSNTKIISQISQRSQNGGLRDKALTDDDDDDDDDFGTVTLRRPLLSESIARDRLLLKNEESVVNGKVELRRPLKSETEAKDGPADKCKRPLTENLQLSRLNFLRNSIHESQPANLSLRRY